MNTSLQLSISNEITNKLSNNTALKDSVVALGQEIEQLFSTKLNELIQKHTGSEKASPPPAADLAAVAPTVVRSTADFLAVSSPAVTSPSQEATWNAPWLATAENGADFLLSDTADAEIARASKPNILEFTTATGADFNTASSLLYGVAGSNTDVRDWQKIMASSDPILAARNATAAMYGPQNPALSKIDDYQIPAEDIVAKTENFTWTQQNGRDRLLLTDSAGNQLREVGLDTPSILGTLQDFGMNPKQLVSLADQLDSSGVSYKPWQLYLGSDAGVDLRALGEGKILGAMAFDWRTPNNAKLAESLGVS